MRAIIGWLALAGVILAAGAPPAAAQGRRISLIRDAEIESTIRIYATPIFNAAGLDNDAVRIHLVNDRALNAFVAGGQRLFVHTGLLMRAESPAQIIGVIAHEAGHIAGAHLVRLQDALRNATTKSIIALVLGTAAALATGDGRVFGAVTAGGQAIAIKDLLRYSRVQESAADQAALRFLDRSGQSSRGLLEFLRLLQSQEAILAGRRGPYLSSHPLTSERVSVIANHVALSRYSDVPTPRTLALRHARMRAKLIGFLQPFAQVERIYPPTDTSVFARYARAIGLFRRADLEPALVLIDGLINEAPDDPYFHELKGQMLFENGRIADALPSYRRAVALAPDEALLRVSLAQAAIELNDPALLADARDQLRTALRFERALGEGWRLLVVAEGRLGATGEMALAQAEYAVLRGDKSAARAHAARAERLLPHGSPGWRRAQDITHQLTR